MLHLLHDSVEGCAMCYVCSCCGWNCSVIHCWSLLMSSDLAKWLLLKFWKWLWLLVPCSEKTLWLHSTTSILSVSLFSDARMCDPLSSFNPVCVSNCCSRLLIKWGHLLAVVMACSVLFASRCCNAYLIVRFKCSMWRSQGMLLPSLPCTLIHLEYMMKIQVHDRKENHVDACNLFL